VFSQILPVNNVGPLSSITIRMGQWGFLYISIICVICWLYLDFVVVSQSQSSLETRAKTNTWNKKGNVESSARADDTYLQQEFCRFLSRRLARSFRIVDKYRPPMRGGGVAMAVRRYPRVVLKRLHVASTVVLSLSRVLGRNYLQCRAMLHRIRRRQY
jgi:hypothetical protein